MSGGMEGRTVLITGGSSGVGLAAARALALQGAGLIMVSRDPARGEAARRAVAAVGGPGRIDFRACDLARLADIRRLAADVLAAYPRLDVLINNAAVIPYRRTLTEDGLETQFAVNHGAYFLLTNLLLNRLRSSAPSRVVLVSSNLHRRARLDFDDLQSESRYRPMRAYGRTKLMNLLMMRELERRWTGTGVTVTAMTPGFTATDLGRSAPPLSRFIFKAFGRSPEKGADTLVYLASSPGVEGLSGRYFGGRREIRMSAAALDDEAARRLWEATAAATQGHR